MPETGPSTPVRSAEASGRERRIPGQRERCQEAYLLLRSLLSRAGQSELVKAMEGVDLVNDVLRQSPHVVPVLLSAAWALRREKAFQDYFLGLDGQPVEAEDIPLAPCGRTFAQLRQSHLLGAARLYFDARQKEWAEAKARSEQAKFKKADQARRKDSLIGGLLANLRDLTGEAPDFSPSAFVSQYRGYGLYEVIKPYLAEDWQFALIPLYAKMEPRQVQAIGELILHFRTPSALEALAKLSPDDIALIRSYARLFAEIETGVIPRSAQANAEGLARFAQEEERTFADLMTTYFGAVPALKTLGARAEQTLRRMVPVFGRETWSLFLDPQQVANVVNCPDNLFKVLGRASRSATPAVTMALSHIQDRILLRDMLKLIVDAFSSEELERHLADPSRLPIWNALPGKFNNIYRYQADAPKDSATLKNFENLQVVTEGIIDSLRKGSLERLG